MNNDQRDQTLPAKIVSGGQTGVDRAALDVALSLNIPCGGWCPRGRRAEDGPLAEKYPLIETETSHYQERTERNILDSDGTLILNRGTLEGGTAFTARLADQYHRPLLIIDLEKPLEPKEFKTWLETQGIRILNVAGPRESGRPGIYRQAATYLTQMLKPELG